MYTYGNLLLITITARDLILFPQCYAPQLRPTEPQTQGVCF